MSRPERRSVLTGFLVPGRHGASDGEPVRLREIRRDAVEITARPGARLSTALGEGVTTFALAPDIWMAIGPFDAPGAFHARIASAIGDAGSVVEAGHGLALLELTGRNAAHVLAKGCRLDLHPSVFGPGACARTIIAQIPATLWRIDDAPGFGLAVPLTFAQSFVHFLLAASAETGCEVLPPED